MSILPIPVKVEIVPGPVDLSDPDSWVWVDITGDLRKSESIRILNGRRAEGAQVAPAEMSLMVNNRHGKYSRHNPNSPYYGQLSLDTPIRVSVDVPDDLIGFETIVSDTFTRDDTVEGWGVAETGGEWIPVDIEDGDRVFISGNRAVMQVDTAESPSQAFSYQFSNWNEGDIFVTVSPAQVSTGALGSSFFTRIGYMGDMWIGVHFRASDDRVSLQLGHDQPPATSLVHFFVGSTTYVANDEFRVHIRLRGSLHSARLWRVGDPEPTTWLIEDVDHTLAEPQPWLYVRTGVTVANTNVDPIMHFDDYEVQSLGNKIRFPGFVNEWPPRWDQSGNDAYVPIQASGIIRRLEQGLSALDSTLTRQVPTMPEVVAYWPMEDGADSRSFASPVSGVPSMFLSGDVDLASQVATGGSKSLPLFKAFSQFSGRVPNHAVDGAWRVDWLFRMSEAPTGLRTAMHILTSSETASEWRIWVSDTELRIQAFADEEGLVYNGATTIHPDFFGDWVRFAFIVSPSGSQVRWDIATFRPDGASPIALNSVFDIVPGTRTIGRVVRVGQPQLGPTAPTDRSLGHVTVSRANVDPYAGIADDGYQDERAVPRIQRLAIEEGIPVRVVGDPEGSMPMGAQGPNTFLDLVRDCAAADGGFLYEDGFGLAYQTRRARYNQPTVLIVDQAAGELARAPEPIDDDRFARNDVTVKRTDGSSFRAVVESIARRDEQVELNVARDDVLANIAWWRINLGTVDELRWPSIAFLLNRPANEHLIGPWTLTQLGNRVGIPLGYDQLPGVDVDVLVDGWQEVIDEHRWSVTLNAAPASPWLVFQIEHSELGRLDTDGSTLAAAIGEADTSVAIASNPGPVWINSTDHAAHFPFHVEVAGEEWEVTAITGTTSPQTFTVVRSVNGVVKSHVAGASIRIFPQVHWSL